MWNYSDFLNCVIDLQDNGRCFLLVHCYFYILYGPCEFSISQMYVCDVYVGGKVRVLELMRFFYLKHSGSKINFVL